MTSPLSPEREAEIRARAEADTCDHTVVDYDGIEQPCDRHASSWRWYQDVEHEDMLHAACSLHANDGGRLIASLLAALDHERAENQRLRDAIESVHHQDTVKAIFCDEDCRDHEDECPVRDLVVCAGCARLADDVDPYYADRPVPEGVIWPCATAAALAAPTPEETS